MKSITIEPIFRKLSLDLGFRRNAAIKPGNHEHALLSQGMTVIDVDANPISLARKLKPADELAITIYDLTPSPPTDDPVISMSLALRFSAGAIGQGERSPIDGGRLVGEQMVFSDFKIFRFSEAVGASTVFDEYGENWVVRPSGSNFPENQLRSGSRQAEMIFELVHKGNFYLSISLDVGWKGGDHKQFRVDPEMICSSSGGGDDEPPLDVTGPATEA